MPVWEDSVITDNEIKVLLITGSGRSGSTIFDNVLGQVPGFFSCGEIRFIWERGFVNDRLCGCGVPFSECPFWGQVIAEAFGGRDKIDPHRMIEQQNALLRARRIPATLSRSGTRKLRGMAGDYLDAMDRLYRAIRSTSGARVIVDSSKLPIYGYVLTMLPSLDVRGLQLVRDSRATAYSWARKKELPDFRDVRYMERFGAAKAAALWALWNTMASVYWRSQRSRYLRLRYEDFVERPDDAVRRAVSLAGEPYDLPVVDEDNTVELRPNHSVAGNPSRLKSGRVALRVDDEWTSKMPPRQRALVTALTWPLLVRFGYRIRPRRSSGAPARSS